MIALYRAPYFWRDYDKNPSDNHNWELGFGEKREGYWSRVVIVGRRLLLEDDNNILVQTFTAHDGEWIELELPLWRIPCTKLWFRKSELLRVDPLDGFNHAIVVDPGHSTPDSGGLFVFFAADEDEPPTRAPVATERHAAPHDSRPAATVPKLGMSRSGLVKAHLHEWPTMERDMKDASTNGLAAAGKTGSRHWDEAAALQWARAKGKLKGNAVNPGDALAQSVHRMATLPGKKHSLDG
jgi:hypothetical protein